MKIILVEDNETVRNMVTELLRILGHDVLIAADKGLACELIQNHLSGVDLILTDCDLPAPDEGLEVLAFAENIIDFSGLNNVSKILMSGRYRATEAERAGAEFLPKPFTLADLTATIQRAKNKKALPA